MSEKMTGKGLVAEGIALAGAAAAGAATALVVRGALNRAPQPDQGSAVFAARDERAVDTLTHILTARGKTIQRRVVGDRLIRVVFGGGELVLNAPIDPDQPMPTGAAMMEVDNPLAAAKEDALTLQAADETADIRLLPPEQGTHGQAVLLLTDALRGGNALGYREPLDRMAGDSPKTGFVARTVSKLARAASRARITDAIAEELK